VAEAYIVGAVRTPVGSRKGALKDVHSADLGAHALKALMERTGVDPSAVEDVIMGCVMQAGVENMAMVPMGASVPYGPEGAPAGLPWGEGWGERYGKQEISQFRGAELMAEKWGLTREELEAFALESNIRAGKAIEAGYFDREIAPLAGLDRDECARPDTTMEKMAALKTLREGGVITAAVSSQIAIGASALLIASEEAVRTHNLTPRARIHTLALAGSDPVFMLTGPIPATEKAFKRSGLSMSDIDVTEINEAFAPVVLAWQREFDADMSKVNPNGGAIALGHPLGATGGILMTKLLHELERTGGRYGLQTMCEGGGQANATIIERL